MKFCERNDLIDRQSYVAQYVSLAMFTIGVTTMLGSDDLLAAFSCGTAFAWDGFFNSQTEQSVFSSVIDLLFNIAAFVFIGAWMPFNSFSNAELTLSVWRLIVIAILVLLLRRLPIMLALFRWIPDVKTFREAVFSGHFGPIGVGAVFISTLAAEALPKPENPQEDQVQMLAATIQPIVAFMVLTSITIHGLSIPFFSLGRRVHSVSRTWSRHQSMDPSSVPEWAAHTRRVSRPEDIIINRDRVLSHRESAMERGELGVSTPNEKMSRRGSSMMQDEKSSHSPSSAESAAPLNGSTEKPTGDAVAETEARADSPPDGEETTAEWQEGPDLVIEQRSGPGEEVEVQVLRGAAKDEDGSEDSVLASIRTSAAEAEEAVSRIKDRLKVKTDSGKEDLQAELHRIKDEVGGGLRDFEKKVRGSLSGLESPAESSRDAQLHGFTQSDGEDEEDGWASDGSTGSRRPDHDQAEQNRRRSKSPKLKMASKASHSHSHSSSRRRNSMRKGLLGRTRPSTAPSITTTVVDAGEEEEEDRGRGVTPTFGGLANNLHHRRVESLRTPIISRSASPARSLRSIRFADDGRNDSGPSSPLSPTKQVAFDVPE